MFLNFVKGNVARLEGITNINNQYLEKFALWNSGQGEPDETTVSSSEELLEIHNGLSMETLDRIS